MDDLGEVLVEELQATPRASFSELARRAGVPRLTTSQRLNAMFDDGTVRVVAAVHPGLLGLHALAHVAIQLAGPAEPVLRELVAMEGPVFVSQTVGQSQVVAELHTPEREQLTACLAQIRAMPGVMRTDVLLYERVVKSFFSKPEPPPEDFGLDEHDEAIIAVLQTDGRASFTDLAAATGLPASTCRNRTTRLFDSGSLHVGVVRRRAGTETAMAFGMGFRTRGDQAQLIGALEDLRGMEFVATTTGRYDVLATVGVPTPRRFIEVSSALAALSCVQGFESWQHAEIVCERYARPLPQ